MIQCGKRIELVVERLERNRALVSLILSLIKLGLLVIERLHGALKFEVFGRLIQLVKPTSFLVVLKQIPKSKFNKTLNTFQSPCISLNQTLKQFRDRQTDSKTMSYDDVEIEDMEWNEELQAFTYPCPCGDLFQITKDDLRLGEEIARCPSCSLYITVVYNQEDFLGDNDKSKKKNLEPAKQLPISVA